MLSQVAGSNRCGHQRRREKTLKHSSVSGEDEKWNAADANGPVFLTSEPLIV